MAPITDADEVALTRRLDDLGRRINAAQARAAALPETAPPPAAPPAPPRRDERAGGSRVWILLVVVLLGVIAGVAGVGALIGDSDGGGDRATTPPAVVEEAPALTEEAPAAPVADAPAAPVEEAPVFEAPAAPSGTDGDVTVVEGDSFWVIAERTVADDLGRAPTDAEVTGYWAQLLDANADRLVEPGNPNLILPGQQLVLVALGTAG